MLCRAEKVNLDLMSDCSIRITFRCATKYEAAVLYEEMNEAAKSGLITLQWQTKAVEEITPIRGTK